VTAKILPSRGLSASLPRWQDDLRAVSVKGALFQNT
jgi:hypothetical protein